MIQRLASKSAIVTGAGSGIGRAIARAFAAEGARVACADIDGAAARVVTAEIAGQGGSAIPIEMDVTRWADCERTVQETLAAFGGLDVLANNAGIAVLGPLLSLSEAEWDRQQAVNVKGVFLMTKAALPSMLARGGGCVIMIASLAGLRGGRDSVAYVASKHAVVGMTRALAVDHAADGVRVNAICPGFVETPLAERFARARGQEYADFRKDVARQIPLGRLGTPDDVAAIAVHLSAAESRWTTGICYSIDGGASLASR